MVFTFWGQVVSVAFLVTSVLVLLWFVPLLISVWKTYQANK
jgi:hypothetical protein